jgi:hypothetical protein
MPELRKQSPALRRDNLDALHLWTIRSADVYELSRHRRDMEDMGFSVGNIEVSKGWRESCLPSGWFYFSARILKAALSAQDFETLCAWDRAHGELPNVKGDRT